MKSKTADRLLNIVLILIFIAYAYALTKIVLLKSGLTADMRSLQLVPFRCISDMLAAEAGFSVAMKNVAGNFAIFIPLGILLPALFRKVRFLKSVLIGFLVSLGFELLQYAIGCGITDIDDLILNTLGCLAGAALYCGLLERGGKRLRARLIAVILLAVFGVCGLLALWLYHPSMLPKQIAYENTDALGETERESYDVSGICTALDAQAVHLREGSPDTFTLSDDVMILLEHRIYQYSPNGNIQKMTVRYERAGIAAASSAIATEDHGGFADLWLDGNRNCRLLILTVFDN